MRTKIKICKRCHHPIFSGPCCGCNGLNGAALASKMGKNERVFLSGLRKYATLVEV